MGTKRWIVDQAELLPTRLKDSIGERASFLDFLVAFVFTVAEEDQILQVRTTRKGAPSYDRRMLLMVWLYALRLGIVSCRKVEEACRYRTDFMYLTGRQTPDHSTLWLFWNEYRPLMKDLFRRMIASLREMSLVKGDTVLVDGTMVAAAGSRHKIRSVEDLTKALAALDEDLESRAQRVSEGEPLDEPAGPSIADKELLREKIRAALAEEKKREEAAGKVCVSDPESAIVKYKDYGSGPGHNVQVTTDSFAGMIVCVEATSDRSDAHQLTRQTVNAGKMLGGLPRAVVADTGYHVTDELAAVEALGVEAYTPEKPNPQNAPTDLFSAQHFRYDEEHDVLICPAEQTLRHARTVTKPTGRTRTTVYKEFRAGTICRTCVHFGVCTKNKAGRTVKQQLNQAASQKTAARTASDAGKEMLRKRKTIEHRLSDLKCRINLRRIAYRGTDKVTQFFMLGSMALNIDRAHRLLQVGPPTPPSRRRTHESIVPAPLPTPATFLPGLAPEKPSDRARYRSLTLASWVLWGSFNWFTTSQRSLGRFRSFPAATSTVTRRLP